MKVIFIMQNKIDNVLKDLTLLDQIKWLIKNKEDIYVQQIKQRRYLYQFVIDNTKFLDNTYKFSTRVYYVVNGLHDFVKCKYDNKPIKRNIYSINQPCLQFCCNKCRRLFFNSNIMAASLQPDVIEKRIQTHYENNNGQYFSTETIQQGKETRYKNNNGNYFSDEQIQKITDSNNKYWNSNEFKEIVKSGFYKSINKKGNETKKKNGTFNTSKQEERVYCLLIKKFGKDNILRQYISELYPFNCDFYIKTIDTYIECNFNWTHNNHFYDCTNIKDQETLILWKEKSIKSNFYKNAIDTWTIRDVQKHSTAEINKLNYLVFWKLDDAEEWIKQL